MCTSPTLALPSLDLVSIQMRNRPRCQIHVCRSSVLSKLSSEVKIQRSFNQFRWLVLDIYLDFLGCVKSCGRLPDCSVLSPPELALEVIWWNVAFCLLLLDLLLQKKENAVLLRLLEEDAGILKELSLFTSSSSQALRWLSSHFSGLSR